MKDTGHRLALIKSVSYARGGESRQTYGGQILTITYKFLITPYKREDRP